MSSPDSNNQDESPEADAGGRAGADPIEALVTPAQILQALTAVADVAGRLGNLERVQQEQTSLLRDALARPSGPAPAAEEVPWQVLRIEQTMLWSWETGRDGPQALRQPRPSIIGRALYDLEQAADYYGSIPAEIYITISVSGSHHLSGTASNYVTRYQAGEKRAMSAKINEHLAPRFDAISNSSRRRYYAVNEHDRRSLTPEGRRLFRNWPHWSVRDDDFTGDGRSATGSSGPVGPAGTT